MIEKSGEARVLVPSSTLPFAHLTTTLGTLPSVLSPPFAHFQVSHHHPWHIVTDNIDSLTLGAEALTHQSLKSVAVFGL